MSRLLRIVFLLPLIALFAAFLLYPLAILLLASVREDGGVLNGISHRSKFSLTHYRELVCDPLYRTALVHSLVLSAAVALTATLLCLAPAWLFARYEFPGKRIMRAGFALPMSLSGIMVGFFTVIMLGRVGFIPRIAQALTGHAWLAGSAYQLTGLVIAYLYFEIPRGILTLESSLQNFDPHVDSAARSLGADRWQRFRWIVLPLIAPALLSTFAVTFGVSLGSFGVALIVSKRFSLLPLELFNQFTALVNTPLASAIATVLVIVALALNLGIARWIGRIPHGHA